VEYFPQVEVCMFILLALHCDQRMFATALCFVCQRVYLFYWYHANQDYFLYVPHIQDSFKLSVLYDRKMVRFQLFF
jgi:hypothetical protein